MNLYLVFRAENKVLGLGGVGAKQPHFRTSASTVLSCQEPKCPKINKEKIKQT